jgi:8-oxo-dGTP pyrophosphatase MutT (NUDIX family)
MGRKEYANDPDAPAPNSLVPAVSAVVSDDSGRVLLQRRADNELWSVPGGAIEVGESVLDALRREVLEETGLQVEPGRLIGVYSSPAYVIAYDDGEVRQQFSLAFACHTTGGTLTTSSETLEVAWFAPEDLGSLAMSAGAVRRIDDFLQHHDQPVVD